MVSASAATSPLASTTSLRLRSPLATAVTTAAMPRTWSVTSAAIRFTLSVRSFQIPGPPGPFALPARLAARPPLRGPPRPLGGEAVELAAHDFDRVLHPQDLPPPAPRALPGGVAPGEARRPLGDVGDLARELTRQ